MNRRALGRVVVAPARPAESVQVGVQSRHIAELLTVPTAVDQHGCGPQSELGVMTEKHLTHDPSLSNVTTKADFTHYTPEVHHGRDNAGPLPARHVVRGRLGLRLRLVRTVRQVADGSRLEPDGRSHRTAGRRRL